MIKKNAVLRNYLQQDFIVLWNDSRWIPLDRVYPEDKVEIIKLGSEDPIRVTVKTPRGIEGTTLLHFFSIL